MMGLALFDSMLTIMARIYIRNQLLALTKGHEERKIVLHGIAASACKYGHAEPTGVWYDNPPAVCFFQTLKAQICVNCLFHFQDKSLILDAFPSMGENLTPIGIAHGLKTLTLAPETTIVILQRATLIESVLASIIAVLKTSPSAHVLVSFDAEWNMTRRVGGSILQLAPHSFPNKIYIIPVAFIFIFLAVVVSILLITLSLSDSQVPHTFSISPPIFPLRSSFQNWLKCYR